MGTYSFLVKMIFIEGNAYDHGLIAVFCCQVLLVICLTAKICFYSRSSRSRYWLPSSTDDICITHKVEILENMIRSDL